MVNVALGQVIVFSLSITPSVLTSEDGRDYKEGGEGGRGAKKKITRVNECGVMRPEREPRENWERTGKRREGEFAPPLTSPLVSLRLVCSF